MGTIKTTNIEPIADNGTVTLGSSGDTITIPSGVTMVNNGTQTGFGGTNTPYFFAYRSASYTINSGEWTKVIFDAEDFDTASGFNVSTGTYTVQTAGTYYFQFSLRSQAANGASSSRRTFCYLERTRSGTSVQRGNAGFDFSDNYTTGNTVDGSAILDCQVNFRPIHPFTPRTGLHHYITNPYAGKSSFFNQDGTTAPKPSADIVAAKNEKAYRLKSKNQIAEQEAQQQARDREMAAIDKELAELADEQLLNTDFNIPPLNVLGLPVDPSRGELESGALD